MKIIRVILPLAILNLISLILVTFTLPNIVPLHLNAGGAVDLFGSKWYIPILGMIPLLVAIFYIVYSYYQKSSINKNIEDKIIPLIVVFLMAVVWIPVFLALNNSKNFGFNIVTLVLIAVAIYL